MGHSKFPLNAQCLIYYKFLLVQWKSFTFYKPYWKKLLCEIDNISVFQKGHRKADSASQPKKPLNYGVPTPVNAQRNYIPTQTIEKLA